MAGEEITDGPDDSLNFRDTMDWLWIFGEVGGSITRWQNIFTENCDKDHTEMEKNNV
jgi:hypothetical protein